MLHADTARIMPEAQVKMNQRLLSPSPSGLASVLALSLLLLTPGCPAAGELLLQAAQLRAHGIELAPAGAGTALRGATLPAQVVVPTAQLRVVAAPLGGVVDSLLAAPGETVRRGQPLARLASREVLELQRDAAQAGSQAALLQQNLARDEKLFAEGLIAEARLQATRAAAAQAATQASERRQGLQWAGAGGSGGIAPLLTINAPISGVVLEQSAQTGQRVEATAPLYRIAALSPLWLEIQAPLATASTLRVGQALRLPELGLEARLIAVGRAVDPASQSVLLRAEVRQGAERLTPGQMLAVELPGAGPAQAQARLPAAAVVRNGEQHLVFVRHSRDDKSGAQHFAALPVRIVAQGGDSVTVDGLKGDEMLVVRGASALKAMLLGIGRE